MASVSWLSVRMCQKCSLKYGARVHVCVYVCLSSEKYFRRKLRARFLHFSARLKCSDCRTRRNCFTLQVYLTALDLLEKKNRICKHFHRAIATAILNLELIKKIRFQCLLSIDVN